MVAPRSCTTTAATKIKSAPDLPSAVLVVMVAEEQKITSLFTPSPSLSYSVRGTLVTVVVAMLAAMDIKTSIAEEGLMEEELTAAQVHLSGFPSHFTSLPLSQLDSE